MPVVNLYAPSTFPQDMSIASDNVGAGRLAAEHLIAFGRRRIAILSGDHTYGASAERALGAGAALREAGRRVPEDVAVTGHDNWEILALGSRPPLTSIDMNLEDLGRLGAARLREAIEGESRPGVDMVPCRLVVHGSTIA